MNWKVEAGLGMISPREDQPRAYSRVFLTDLDTRSPVRWLAIFVVPTPSHPILPRTLNATVHSEYSSQSVE